MNRLLKILMFTLLWAAILCAIYLLSVGERSRREGLRVSDVMINIVDSTANGNLVTREMVESMLSRERIKLRGESVASLPLSYVERVIARNGFVESVAVYVDYAGVMNIDISQRSAVARLLVNGYNCYVTGDGFIFDAPSNTALYTPVATGDYRPFFKSGYVGYISDRRQELIEEIEREIERVEREKYPIYLRERKNQEDRRSLRRSYISQLIFESDEDFDKKVTKLKKKNRERRERYASIQRTIDGELNVLEQRQERYREEQKKVEKKCEDIENLITFVKSVESDPFWRSEIVQIELRQGERGEMRVRLAVRSGRFIVTMGNMPTSRRELYDKLERLKEFYGEALPRVGWDRYKEINIEYKNQVICKR